MVDRFLFGQSLWRAREFTNHGPQGPSFFPKKYGLIRPKRALTKKFVGARRTASELAVAEFLHGHSSWRLIEFTSMALIILFFLANMV